MIADRNAGATWDGIARPHEVTADTARARWGHLYLTWPPQPPTA
ncbi:hypothetical protein [Streptomyces sp. DvalAA-19]|nr:hypothetical protein [Streptomyces sp. DvalAA-19]SCE22229.1 hypothetical protein GA0115244_12087 [Streptomyces sp. DvalAA-19]